MGHAAAMGVFKAADGLVDQVDHPRRIDRPPDLHQFAERLPLDELHREVTRAVLLADVLDRHDVGMPEQAAHLTFVLERPALVWIVGEPVAEHLDSEHGPGVAMDRAIDPGEGAGADLIEDLRTAEVVAAPLTTKQALQLEAGDQLAAHQRLTKRRRIERVATRLREGLVEGRRRDEFQFADEVEQVVGR